MKPEYNIVKNSPNPNLSVNKEGALFGREKMKNWTTEFVLQRMNSVAPKALSFWFHIGRKGIGIDAIIHSMRGALSLVTAACVFFKQDQSQRARLTDKSPL